MNTHTSYTLPPIINKFFSKTLLLTPCPKLCDDLDVIWRIFKYIELYLIKKCKNFTTKVKQCEKLKEDFLDLYERTKAKKKKLEAKAKNATEGPFYYVKMPNTGSQYIFQGLRSKSYKVPSKFWKDDAV